MIREKKNKTSSGNNSFEFTKDVNLCCGDVNPGGTVCYYQANIPAGVFGTPAVGIEVNGTVLYFTSTPVIDKNQVNLDAVKDVIVTALANAGYTGKDISVSYNEDINVIEIKAGPSEGISFGVFGFIDGSVSFTSGCPPYEFNGIVFEDTNDNEIYDGGEPTIDNVTMQLFDNSGLTGTPLQESVSTGGGKYGFTDLTPGVTYYVTFDSTVGAGVGRTAAGSVPKAFSFTAGGTYSWVNFVSPYFDYPIKPVTP